ncbi:FTR1 family iron permease [Paludibacterium yongneupense]|uniref:FTR1 family iron permease n=1 Tax=Paludibacterium yongneupense TaxID=400061 RepID=UPI001FE263A7|nr:FTR1 family protein [Paludibacterium yongneupense]
MFIVWRESVEALLVVGILNAWMNQSPQGRAGKRYLWGGVLLGLLAALLLAFGLFAAASALGGAEDLFRTFMVLVAAALIVHMVRWMRLHGRTLKQELEAGLEAQASASRWWGVLVLCAIAVAREGSETVVFLFGMLDGASASTLASMGLASCAGFALALATFWILQLGGKYLSWRLFFRVTEIMLLLLAGGLLVNGIEQLISLDVLPALVDPVWDSSRWLDDSSLAGSIVASLTGYRSHPALTSLLALGLFWGGVWRLIYRDERRVRVNAR